MRWGKEGEGMGGGRSGWFHSHSHTHTQRHPCTNKNACEIYFVFFCPSRLITSLSIFFLTSCSSISSRWIPSGPDIRLSDIPSDSVAHGTYFLPFLRETPPFLYPGDFRVCPRSAFFRGWWSSAFAKVLDLSPRNFCKACFLDWLGVKRVSSWKQRRRLSRAVVEIVLWRVLCVFLVVLGICFWVMVELFGGWVVVVVVDCAFVVEGVWDCLRKLVNTSNRWEDIVGIRRSESWVAEDTFEWDVTVTYIDYINRSSRWWSDRPCCRRFGDLERQAQCPNSNPILWVFRLTSLSCACIASRAQTYELKVSSTGMIAEMVTR